MKKQDIRMDIVNKLETYCGERGVSFCWAEEKIPSGSLVVRFAYNGKHITYRITNSVMENIKGDIDVIVKKLIIMVEEFLLTKGG